MKDKKPKLKFRISQAKDLKTLFAFISDAKYDQGRGLKWAVFDKYPIFEKYRQDHSIKISKKQAQIIIEKIYQKNEKIIKKNLVIYKNNWQEVEESFFDLVGDIFSDHKWPKGKYIAYPTIWGMFPRFLEDKTFQIPFKHKKERYVNVVIAHEMLHFIFYDYFLNTFPKYKKGDHDFFLWHVSEIFNEVVQSSPSWLKVFKLKTMGYPEHKSVVKKLIKKFHNKNTINPKGLSESIIKEVKNSNNSAKPTSPKCFSNIF